MIALIQRVNNARVAVDDKTVAAITRGLLVFIGIEKNDTPENADKLRQKILNYRVFPDENGKMNLNLAQINGALLLVSQFTLAANTQKGNRPGFDPAMPPRQAETIFHDFCRETARVYPHTVQWGIFGADMQVSLTNDGPVTFWLQC